jgi:hypothetical protein
VTRNATRVPACARTSHEALEAEADRPFGQRIAESEPAPTFGQVHGAFCGRDGTREIAEPVLPKLCHLDPRMDRDRSATRREVVPGRR